MANRSGRTPNSKHGQQNASTRACSGRYRLCKHPDLTVRWAHAVGCCMKFALRHGKVVACACDAGRSPVSQGCISSCGGRAARSERSTVCFVGRNAGGRRRRVIGAGHRIFRWGECSIRMWFARDGRNDGIEEVGDAACCERTSSHTLAPPNVFIVIITLE